MSSYLQLQLKSVTRDLFLKLFPLQISHFRHSGNTGSQQHPYIYSLVLSYNSPEIA